MFWCFAVSVFCFGVLTFRFAVSVFRSGLAVADNISVHFRCFVMEVKKKRLEKKMFDVLMFYFCVSVFRLGVSFRCFVSVFRCFASVFWCFAVLVFCFGVLMFRFAVSVFRFGVSRFSNAQNAVAEEKIRYLYYFPEKTFMTNHFLKMISKVAANFYFGQK